MDLKNILLKRLDEETIYEDVHGPKEITEVIEEVFKEAETKKIRYNQERKWQTRDEMDIPTNPLQRLQEVFAFTSRDCSEDKMIAFMYGVISGWDDDAYTELKVQHNWSDKDVELQKAWHNEYKKAWNLYMDAEANER